jgi:hypothetical protein
MVSAITDSVPMYILGSSSPYFTFFLLSFYDRGYVAEVTSASIGNVRIGERVRKGPQ